MYKMNIITKDEWIHWNCPLCNCSHNNIYEYEFICVNCKDITSIVIVIWLIDTLDKIKNSLDKLIQRK